MVTLRAGTASLEPDGQTRDRRRRAGFVLVLPLVFLLLALWQWQRSAADAFLYGTEADALTPLLTQMQVARGTVTIAGTAERWRAPDAATRLRDGQTALRHDALVAQLRQGVAAIAATGAGLCLVAGAAGLLLAGAAARRSPVSRAALLAAFTRTRRVLPWLLGSQVAGLALALFCTVLFEAAGVWYLHAVDGGALKLTAAAVGIAGLALYLAWLVVRDLVRALAAFTPAPLPVLGRRITAADAPGLWQGVTALAARQGALVPDHIVAGLVDGFFVTAFDVLLSPGAILLQGRSLHLPAPLLALLDSGETDAIIAHELAHFTGEDTVYSQRFLPVYAAIGRSLAAVQSGPGAWEGRWLLLPAATLGRHMADVFDAAVKHWSRLREFAADQVSAATAGPVATVAALLRSELVADLVRAALHQTAAHPRDAPPDLVAAIAGRADALATADFAPGATQPHPTDSHPPTAQRIAALGVTVDGALLARARRPTREGPGLATLFADWPALCRTLTADAVAVATVAETAYEEALHAAAEAPGDAPVLLFEATRRPLIVTGLVAAVVLACCAGLTYALLALPTVRPSARPMLNLLDAGLLAAVAVCAVMAWRFVRAGRTPFLTLDPVQLTCRSLDRPIPWQDIIAIQVIPAGVHTVIFLTPDAPLPRRVRGGFVLVKKRRRCITMIGTTIRGMTADAYAALLHTHLSAAHARAILAAKHAPSES